MPEMKCVQAKMYLAGHLDKLTGECLKIILSPVVPAYFSVCSL